MQPFGGTLFWNLYLKPLCGVGLWNHCLKALHGTFIWQPGEPKCGTLWNLEPFKCGIIQKNLEKPEPIYCAEPLNLLSVETFCGTVEPFCGGIFEPFCGTPAKPGARFPAAATNHPEASLEEPQAFQAVG